MQYFAPLVVSRIFEHFQFFPKWTLAVRKTRFAQGADKPAVFPGFVLSHGRTLDYFVARRVLLTKAVAELSLLLFQRRENLVAESRIGKVKN